MSRDPSGPGHFGAPRYAVLFRVHTWDTFVERQYDRLRSRIQDGDVFIVANNTGVSCRIPANLPVVTFTEETFKKLGLAFGVAEQVVWYNVDYPLYHFISLYPDYEYFVIFEYEAVINSSLDSLVARIHADRTDLVGSTKGVSTAAWMWRSSCLELYRPEDIRKQLLPIGIFSRNAVRHLFQRRLILSEMLRTKQISRWPHCEAFIPTELALAGFKINELSRYGSTTMLDYEPAHLEQDLDLWQHESFLHPVLDGPRYAVSTIKYQTRPERFFNPGSEFHRKLARLPLRIYLKPLLRAFADRIRAIPEVFARRVYRRAQAATRPHDYPPDAETAGQSGPASVA